MIGEQAYRSLDVQLFHLTDGRLRRKAVLKLEKRNNFVLDAIMETSSMQRDMIAVVPQSQC